MKNKLLLLLSSLILSLSAYGEWTTVLPGNNSTLYIDFETLEEREGFIYWLYMDSWTDGSAKSNAQGDCNLKGFKVNKRVNFSMPMGEGEGIENNMVSSWEYYEPNTGYEILLNFICQMSKLNPEEQAIRIEALTKRNEEFERQRNSLNKDSEVEQSSSQMSKYFRNEERVTIDTLPSKFWYYTFGSVLIGSTHGDTAKPEKLPQIMAADRPEEWGKSEFRYWYTGHIHNKQSMEFPGVMWESFRTLAGKDAWHFGSGYRAGRDMSCIIHHKEYGEIGRNTASLKLVRHTSGALLDS